MRREEWGSLCERHIGAAELKDADELQAMQHGTVYPGRAMAVHMDFGIRGGLIAMTP